jgi:hypothetical protein
MGPRSPGQDQLDGSGHPNGLRWDACVDVLACWRREPGEGPWFRSSYSRRVARLTTIAAVRLSPNAGISS